MSRATPQMRDFAERLIANHSKDLREYVITDKGAVVIHPRSTEYVRLTTGIPERTGPRPAQEIQAPPEPKAKR